MTEHLDLSMMAKELKRTQGLTCAIVLLKAAQAVGWTVQLVDQENAVMNAECFGDTNMIT